MMHSTLELVQRKKMFEMMAYCLGFKNNSLKCKETGVLSFKC